MDVTQKRRSKKFGKKRNYFGSSASYLVEGSRSEEKMMSTLDRKLYSEGTQVSVGMLLGHQRLSVVCRYLKPVGHGGLHFVADEASGNTVSVPIEDIRRIH